MPALSLRTLLPNRLSRLSRAALAASLGLVMALGAGGANAQDWTLNTYDTGTSTGASTVPPVPSFSIGCTHESPRRLSPQQTGDVEPGIIPPYSVNIGLHPDVMGSARNFGVPATDVMIIVGSNGYRLPGVSYSDYTGWIQPLSASDPLIVALTSGEPIALRTQDATLPIPNGKAAQIVRDMIRHCTNALSQMGHPPPPAITAILSGAPGNAPGPATTGALPPVPGFIDTAAISHILRGCGGPANIPEQAFLRGDIDADGQTDLVVDWHHITCHQNLPRPFCGASNCSADAFLSGSFQRTNSPEQLLSQFTALEPRPDGRGHNLVTGDGIAMCGPGTGRSRCETVWTWTGYALEPFAQR